jgi:histidinol-phosphate phosphatase family protein
MLKRFIPQRLKKENSFAMKKPVICVDRDGTLIHDTKEHLFLGNDNDWKSKVEMLSYAIDGLRLLKSIPNSAIYMITNQAGVAISDFPLLTIERAHEVCKNVVDIIKGNGGHIDGYFLCPHATPEYVKKKPDVRFDEKLVHDCKCLKPELGMVFNALKAENITPDNANVYVIGDRATDVQTALNTGGVGILVPFENEPGEDEKVRKFQDHAHIHIAVNMLKATEFIFKRER